MRFALDDLETKKELRMNRTNDGGNAFLGLSLAGMFFFILCTLVGLGMWGCPQYTVWQQGLEGKAELSKAQFNRQIKIQEAEATLESSKHLANAEIERAKGAAEANKILGDSLKGKEEYLRYLWIEKMNSPNEVIYVPTEAGIPILEAGKRK